MIYSRMKISGFILCLFFFISVTCYGQQNNTKEMKYTVEIIDFFRGRVDHVIKINNDSVNSETDRVHGNPKFFSRELTDKENDHLIRFLKSFPLSILKENYINSSVKDGIQMKFNIKIADSEKSISVANVYQKDLGELFDIIVSLLPENKINYKKEYIQWKVE